MEKTAKQVMTYKDIFVITWRYQDGSANGAVHAYEDESDANRDIEMLRRHGDTAKVFDLEQVRMQKG